MAIIRIIEPYVWNIIAKESSISFLFCKKRKSLDRKQNKFNRESLLILTNTSMNIELMSLLLLSVTQLLQSQNEGKLLLDGFEVDDIKNLEIESNR
jgi:hypothetical protein